MFSNPDSITFNQVTQILSKNKNTSVAADSSILNTKRDPTRTTEKYKETDDVSVVETFNTYGWHITDYREIKVRNKSRQGYQRYYAAYENEDYVMENNGRARIIQLGSHDGTSTLRLLVGFIRQGSVNGFICGDNLFVPITIKHIGKLPEQLVEAHHTLVKTIPVLFNKIRQMQDTTLTSQQAKEFAFKAAQLRFPDGRVVQHEALLNSRVDLNANSNSLWDVFSLVHGNLMLPPSDFKMTTKSNRQLKARPIKNIQIKTTLNRELWFLAESYLS